MTVVTLTEQQILDAMHNGGGAFFLGASQFTYSVPGAGSVWSAYSAGQEPSNSYSTVTVSQAANFQLAIELWDDLIAEDFVQVPDNGAGSGELRIAFTAMDSGTAGYAYSGTPRAPGGKVGDVWLNSGNTGESYDVGTYGFTTLLHEIGHTLGLKHPHEAPTLATEFDNGRFTVMAYNDPVQGIVTDFSFDGTFLTSSRSAVNQVTPMVVDIAAVQGIYGADLTTRTGNDIYAFDDDDGAVMGAIYDAGGEDTIDLSACLRDCDIDLNAGAYSSVGKWTTEEQIAFWVAQFPWAASFIADKYDEDSYEWTDNLGIALNTLIENAEGGAGDDSILGNDAVNKLFGNGGNDTLDGAVGVDRMFGGLGDDVYYSDQGADKTIELDGQGYDTVISTADALRLRNFVEALTLQGIGRVGIGNDLNNTLTANDTASSLFGMDGDDTVLGGIDADRLYGNNGADDLSGGDGNDVLDGGFGTDTMAGGAGNDTYIVADLGDVVTEATGAGTDEVKAFVAHTLSNDVENLTLFGSAAVGTGNARDNMIRGNDGVNTLSGLGNDDTLRGLGGTDTLLGGNGADRLYGGVGEDELTGGAGADQFRFEDGDLRVRSARIETITDFSRAQGDVIRLREIDADTVTGADQDFAFVGTAAFSNTAGELRYQQDGTDTFVYGDTNGDAVADFQFKVSGLVDLVATDFVL